MGQLPFDPENPPDSPPASVVQPLLWRLAVRVYRDHGGDRVDWTWPGACLTCRRPWPCYPRRMAERGLLVACRAPRPGRGLTAYLDDLPGLD